MNMTETFVSLIGTAIGWHSKGAFWSFSTSNRQGANMKTGQDVEDRCKK